MTGRPRNPNAVRRNGVYIGFKLHPSYKDKLRELTKRKGFKSMAETLKYLLDQETAKDAGNN